MPYDDNTSEIYVFYQYIVKLNFRIGKLYYKISYKFRLRGS